MTVIVPIKPPTSDFEAVCKDMAELIVDPYARNNHQVLSGLYRFVCQPRLHPGARAMSFFPL